MANNPKANPLEVQAAAREFASEMLDLTLGEYSAMNRPPVWRDGLGAILYTYKTYGTTMTQLMRNLPPAGRRHMQAALWLAGGVMAFPFAEDAEDLADALAQRFFNVPSARLFVKDMLDDVGLGWLDPLVFRGAMQYLSAGDFGSKFSLGDQLPFTGALAGDEVSNEAIDFGGPLLSFGLDSLAGLGALATFGKDFVMGNPTEFDRVLRTQPIVALRYVSDIYTYHASNAITNARGQVISKEGVGTAILARMLGFYPQTSATANDRSRLVLRSANFYRGISGAYRDMALRALIQKNPDQYEQVLSAVNDWNESNPDMLIRDFAKKTRTQYNKIWNVNAAARVRANLPISIRQSRGDFLDFEDEE